MAKEPPEVRKGVKGAGAAGARAGLSEAPGLGLGPSAVGPGAPALAPEEFQIVEPLCAVFRRTLKAEGLKYTPERAQVLDIIVRSEGLFEAEELMAELKRTGFRVSKATVYRTIKLLQEAGIVQRVPFDDEHSYYQLVYGRKPSDLLIRMDTREVVHLDLPELVRLRDEICGRLGLEPRGHRFQIFAVGEGASRE
jgi:Fur family ferric uptake transcriptional regulator